MNISELDLYQQYYVDGFYESSFKDNDDLDVLKRDMLSILKEDTGSDFYLEKKYPGTKDLRPNAYQYSDSFINILFSNNIPDMIKSLTGKNLTLSHIQVRNSKCTESYMPWHRDSYTRGAEYIGCCPPVHKLIFYPMINVARPKLCLARGSHICNFRHQPEDQFVQDGCSNLDREILKAFEKKYYYSSHNRFLFFNTGILHCVVPESQDEESIRVIYSFVEKFQFDEIYSKKNDHLYLNNIYENFKASICL